MPSSISSSPRWPDALKAAAFCVGFSFLALARSASAAVPPTDTVAGGEHWRFTTSENGPVHVWRPPGYNEDKAVTVIHVHGDSEKYAKWGGLSKGFYNDLQWKVVNIPQQFADSGLNALFIYPDGPTNKTERKAHTRAWKSLDSLISEVESQTGLTVPSTIIAMGHSGAYETLHHWLGSGSKVRHLILLDALYAYSSTFESWFKAANDRSLVIVSYGTYEDGKALEDEVKAFVVKGVPATASDFLQQVEAELGRRAVHIGSQYNHPDIIKEGKVIPIVLQYPMFVMGGAVTNTTPGAAPDAPQAVVPSSAAPPPESAVRKGSVYGIFSPVGAKSPQRVIGKIIAQILGVVGGLTLLVFVYGGILWMTSAGNQERSKKARQTLVWATIGLIFVFSAYALVSFVVEKLA